MTAEIHQPLLDSLSPPGWRIIPPLGDSLFVSVDAGPLGKVLVHMNEVSAPARILAHLANHIATVAVNNATPLLKDAGPVLHVLKCDGPVFQASLDGRRGYEIRWNDRNFQVGDYVRLRETTYTGKEMADGVCPLTYTGNEITKRIDHILTEDDGYGLSPGWVILNLCEVAHHVSDDSTPREIVTVDDIRQHETKTNAPTTQTHCVPGPGEPSFTLLGRDPVAPTAIETWCRLRELNGDDPAKVAGARKIALDMDAFKKANPDLGFKFPE